MQEIVIANKQEYLEVNFPFSIVPKLTEKVRCIHCDHVFFVGDYKVFKDKEDEEFICCAYAPGCDGTLIDWVKSE